MNKLGTREENILNFVIRDYVRNAAPISSGRIFDSGSFRLSPATIRNAMLELDREGFLEQPHTSSGRVPTDKAYRYFVDNLMAFKEPPKKERVLLDELIKDVRASHEILFENFARTLSEELGLFMGVASFKENAKVEGFGLERLFSEPEFDDKNLTVEFSRLVDNLEKVAERFFEGTSKSRPEVFIGEENPVEAREFSSVVMKFSNDEFGNCVIFSLGPKRMNYERASSFINFVVKDIIR
ncbi:hypothetical protein A3B18_00880 [Candidatus Giovannonibacteria bacterium RIFCSPLOWO2_01_FULL_46_13]|uniref:Heat-inducible transcription repressor HrcA C-terminal domain-containing protein n=1 Tax=Candidatus Giovannonibacteria bacterium RIFCSPLOWO2_01_FULL_46_13 TaxID=1798352 RepID=A0A1F5X3U9_9BACT|nr:MAG: hypothetical protein A3B18_00880 [Candidatus Giovannonibacteria bacterium RIFCSPLOWO2_01_FULL_46_13]